MIGPGSERRAFLALAGRFLGVAAALALAGPHPVSGGGRDSDVFAGEETFEDLLRLARVRAWSELAIGHRIGAIGMALRQTPYAAATLELHEDREVCSINLRGLDCVTFFESCLAFARMLRRGGRTPDALLNEVTFIRYRGGQLSDYASRLHYLSDWFFDNASKGVVRPITADLPGATRYHKRVSFMSSHPEDYRQLKAHPALVAKIARTEAEINAREMMYLPKEKIAAAQPLLMTGDIIGVTTTIEGLDCAHSGLAFRDEGGRLRLLHASTTRHAVILDKDVAAYVASVSTHSGIIVARPLEAT